MSRAGGFQPIRTTVIEEGDTTKDKSGTLVFGENPENKAIPLKVSGRDGESLKVVDHYSYLQKEQLKKLDIISKKLDVLQPSGGAFDTEDESLE